MMNRKREEGWACVKQQEKLESSVWGLQEKGINHTEHLLRFEGFQKYKKQFDNAAEATRTLP